MQQAGRQEIPLQQTGSRDRHGRENPVDFQSSPLALQIQWLQHTVELYFLKPKTRKGQILCWSLWLMLAAVVGILFWQVLPRFVDHGNPDSWRADPSLLLSFTCCHLTPTVATTVVKPTIKYIEVYALWTTFYHWHRIQCRPIVVRTVPCRDTSPRFRWLPSLWQEWLYFQCSLFHPLLSCYLFQRC